MNRSLLIAVLFLWGTIPFIVPGHVFAETKETLLSPGKYEVTFAPNVNVETATQIQKEVATISNIEDVKVDAAASVIHFSVKNTNPPTVTLSQLRNAVSRVASDEVLTTPYMQPPPALP